MDQLTADVARFFELVSGVQIRARRTIEGGLRSRDLTYAQFSALQALAAKDGMSQAELAQALDTDSTTAMVLRTSLEKKRLVARVDDPADGRVKRIEITDSGKSALQQALPEARGLHAKAAALVSETDMKRLIPVLERLNDFLGELSAPKKAESDEEPRRKGRPRAEAVKKPAKGAKAAKTVKAPAKRGKAVPKAAPKAKPAPKAKAVKAPAKAKAKKAK